MDCYHLGIDPGLSGGAALLASGVLIKVFKTPENELDWIHEIRECKTFGSVTAVIEDVHAMPFNGSIANHKLGRSYGFWRSALFCLGLPFTAVSPQRWKRHFGLIGKPKNADKDLAKSLFPDYKITHAVADAILLAQYGMEVANSGDSHAATRRLNHEVRQTGSS